MSVRKYILERSLLQPADIILTGDKGGVSLSVRAATISRYSHAAIYVGDTTIEATMAGVFSKNPQRLIFDRLTDVLVLRAKRPLSELETRAICSYAQSKVGSLYALNEAITIKLRTLLRHQDSKQQFCSRLVAKSYEHAEFDLMNLRNPAFCTPKQLALCKAFEPVKGVVRPASEAEIAFAERDDPAQENHRRLYDWLNKVRELVSQDKELYGKWDIQSQNEVDGFLLAHPEYDIQISKYMEDSEYLDFYTIESRHNPYRYKIELFMHRLSQTEEPDEFIDDELSKEINIFQRFAKMQNHYADQYKIKNLKFFKLQIQLYNNMLSEILVRVSVVREALLELGLIDEAESLEASINAVASVVREGHEALRGAS
ncbi:hypothetical protein ALQ04_03984 [Pseudomonas cichorii]|uniref:Permuted papain-like amidase enzyme, YaeF/YiiX, C92 family n=1 Tax=Pseudomonas cichorii TaxID=36746 RepID=A0A3M4LIG9_PSECI|nr:YiiX/YebB-like N1pC/P60 family cysteine hydrolase [Pseudomonas cichorii]MCF8978006.1 hypothetical protein [Pseudomonas syringae]RMQ41315.1 hypothetical protein ALQ04_03984 [Pseudomonas cichorii]